MGATRLVLTVGVVGIAAGAFLALALVPSFAPYRHRDRSELPIVVRDVAEPAYSSEREAADDGWGIAPGAQRGTLVLQLPRWAHDTGGWLAYGASAWQAWRNWSEPSARNDESRDGRADRGERFVGRRDWRDEVPYGNANEGEDRWSNQMAPPETHADPPSDRRSDDDDLDRSDGDVAAQAAQDAYDAARDVLAAEDAAR